MKRYAALFFLLFACNAPAAVVNGEFVIDWTPPDARADGTPLAPAEIAGYELDADGALLTADIPADTASITPPATPGMHCYIMRTVDVNGLVSADSDQLCANSSPPGKVIIKIHVRPRP